MSSVQGISTWPQERRCRQLSQHVFGCSITCDIIPEEWHRMDFDAADVFLVSSDANRELLNILKERRKHH